MSRGPVWGGGHPPGPHRRGAGPEDGPPGGGGVRRRERGGADGPGPDGAVREAGAHAHAPVLHLPQRGHRVPPVGAAAAGHAPRPVHGGADPGRGHGGGPDAADHGAGGAGALLRHPGGGQEPRLKRPGRDADGGGLYPVRPGGGAGAVRPERRHPGRVQPWDGPARAGGVLRGRGGRHGGVRPGQPAAHGELRPGGAAARRRDPAPDGPRGPGGSGGEAGQAGGQGIAEGGEGALRNPGAGPGGHRPGAVFPRHGPVSAPDLPQALYGGGLSARGRLRGLFRVRPGGRAGQDLSVAAGGGRQDPDGAGGAGRQLRPALPQLQPAV